MKNPLKLTPEEKLYRQVEKLKEKAAKDCINPTCERTSYLLGQIRAYTKTLQLMRNILGVGND